MITGCKHKLEDGKVYYFVIDKKLTIRLCSDCHDKLLLRIFEQFVLEHRCQTMINDALQHQIYNLGREIDLDKGGKNDNKR